MKTEEQCMFGNYLLSICCTFPDIAVIGKKCLEAVWRLHNSVLWRPTDRALYFQVVCCLPWCQRKYVARVKRKAPSVLLAVCFSSFARKPVHEFKEPNSGIETFKLPDTVQLSILQCHMSRTRQRRSNKRNSKCALKSTNKVTLKMHKIESKS